MTATYQPGLYDLPKTGFLRLPVVLKFVPVSKSSWWKGVQEGRFPAPIKLGPRTTAWRARDIHALIEEFEQATEAA